MVNKIHTLLITWWELRILPDNTHLPSSHKGYPLQSVVFKIPSILEYTNNRLCSNTRHYTQYIISKYALGNNSSKLHHREHNSASIVLQIKQPMGSKYRAVHPAKHSSRHQPCSHSLLPIKYVPQLIYNKTLPSLNKTMVVQAIMGLLGEALEPQAYKQVILILMALQHYLEVR